MEKNASLFTLIIFGATGNLSQLKLIPALYDLAAAGLLPPQMRIIGIGRKPFSDDEFRTYSDDVMHQPNRHHNHPIKRDIADQLLAKMTYVEGDMGDPKLYEKLSGLFSGEAACNNRMYYLATYPELYPKIFENLESHNLNSQDCGWVRVIIEKPIGTDLTSASALNSLLSKYYVEDQIFRLDHYLGKETLQNILTFRFGNGIFEPLINKDYIDHIQVTASEDFDIGLRGGYYDKVGALKDVGQNHILQMLALSTMDAPASFSNADITAQRIRLIEKLIPNPTNVVFGQYEGYLKEKDVTKNSRADTFFAFRTEIQSERFQHVPIYVRAGKAMAQTVTEVAIIFKVAGKRLFEHVPGGCEPNVLIYRIQPNEGIVLRFLTKVPGQNVSLQNEYMQYCYRMRGNMLPDPYLRLLVDVFRGDQTFFIDAPEAEAQWRFTDPLSAVKTKPIIYPRGSWGPKEADDLIQADDRQWLTPSLAFCAL